MVAAEETSRQEEEAKRMSLAFHDYYCVGTSDERAQTVDAATQCDLITTSSVSTQCYIQPRTASKGKFFFLDVIFNFSLLIICLLN